MQFNKLVLQMVGNLPFSGTEYFSLVLKGVEYFSVFLTVEGETYASTSMVDHFKLQWVEIGNLENELYQFKTVGKNDNGESIESGITEARPLPGVVSAWIFLFLFFFFFCIHRA